MIKKIPIFFIIFLYSCGYSTVYKNDESINYNIIISEMTGDITMNRLIKNELEIHSDENSENNYIVKLDTSYLKQIKTKNSSGIASNYEMIVVANFKINSQTITFEEKFLVKNMSDSLEQRNYESIIMKNFASSIKDKLIIKLLNVKW